MVATLPSHTGRSPKLLVCCWFVTSPFHLPLAAVQVPYA
jgi:hypothetical protein